jgi:hypothetical protein
LNGSDFITARTGSCGIERDHSDISKKAGERMPVPAVRKTRHDVEDVGRKRIRRVALALLDRRRTCHVARARRAGHVLAQIEPNDFGGRRLPAAQRAGPRCRSNTADVVSGGRWRANETRGTMIGSHSRVVG